MEATHQLKEHQTIRGVLTFRNFLLPDTLDIQLVDQFLKYARNLPRHVYQDSIESLARRSRVRSKVVTNLVHLSGRSVFARRLIGDPTYSGEISHGALGTGTTAINDNHTTLAAEVARKHTASRFRTNDSVTIDFYYSKNDTDGTYNEFGTFIDGTNVADSGQMFNRALTGGWSKSDAEAMTVSLQIDLSSA